MEPVPFFKPAIGDDEIQEVLACLKSGWLTTGPRTRQFEEEFATAVGAKFAIAVNSCTAALHLAVASLKLQPGDGVLVPTWTFAATAEVVQYLGGIPILVDCDPVNFHFDLNDAQRKLDRARAGTLSIGRVPKVVGMIPVHVAGAMMNMDEVQDFASHNGLWIVEDAAHSLPAAYTSRQHNRSIHCGSDTADATCFSFYANKTITTGEGGMIVTDSQELAEQMRCLSLHGLSSLAWNRFSNNANWDYRILEAGFKYNLTDLASSIGLHQLKKAESLRLQRQQIAEFYRSEFHACSLLEIPKHDPSLLHSWHLYPIRLKTDRLNLSRNEFCDALRAEGIGFSVHWRPLHLHPLYQDRWKWEPSEFPNANSLWPRTVSLPIFAGMTLAMQERVVASVLSLLQKASRR